MSPIFKSYLSAILSEIDKPLIAPSENQAPADISFCSGNLSIQVMLKFLSISSWSSSSLSMVAFVTGKKGVGSIWFSLKNDSIPFLSSLVMLIAKLFGESSGMEPCQEPSKFLLAEKVIKLSPIAIVKAKIWKELPSFLLRSSDNAKLSELDAPKPVSLFPRRR